MKILDCDVMTAKSKKETGVNKRYSRGVRGEFVCGGSCLPDTSSECDWRTATTRDIIDFQQP